MAVGADIFNESCDVTSNLTDEGYNVGDTTCENGGTDDSTASLAGFLGGLGNNGGTPAPTTPPETVSLVTGGSNPAIGRIPDPTTGFCPATDERGDASAASTNCDAGAYQSSGSPLTQTVSFTSTDPGTVLVGATYTPTATGTASGNPVVITIDPSSTSVCS